MAVHFLKSQSTTADGSCGMAITVPIPYCPLELFEWLRLSFEQNTRRTRRYAAVVLDEKTLFSERPPQLIDFHEASLVISYQRPSQEKVIRISVEESFHSCANP